MGTPGRGSSGAVMLGDLACQHHAAWLTACGRGAEGDARRGGGAALFSHSGAHIFAAAAGVVAVLDAASLQVLHVLQARSPRRRIGSRHGCLPLCAGDRGAHAPVRRCGEGPHAR